MLCSCKNCRAALPSIYCVGTRTLSPAESRRVEELLARARALRETGATEDDSYNERGGLFAAQPSREAGDTK